MFSGIHVLFRCSTSDSSRFLPFSKPAGLPTSFKCSQQATDLESIRMPFVKWQKCDHTFLGESSSASSIFSVRSMFQNFKKIRWIQLVCESQLRASLNLLLVPRFAIIIQVPGGTPVGWEKNEQMWVAQHD